MLLESKLLIAATGLFVVSSFIIAIIPLVNMKTRNSSSLVCTDNNSGDLSSKAALCGTVECSEQTECITEEGTSPSCTCISGFVTIERETDKGSEIVCHKICEKSSDCWPYEVCKDDPNLGIFCVAQRMSDCRRHEVCKEDPKGIFCVASMDLDTCDGVRCEDPEVCDIVNNCPKCKCHSNELLIEPETTGIPERRCRKRCRTADDCEAGTLCFEGSFLTSYYCEDRDRIRDCSISVRCTSETECRLTNDNKIECLCRNELESTHIQSTESGSTRTCKTSTCEDSDGCQMTELCLRDKYSKQAYCEVRGDKCLDEVVCHASTICKRTTDGLAECLCESGYTEIRKAGLHATTRTCHPKSCTDSNGCQSQLCYQDETSKEFYCADAAKGCDGAVCPDKKQCFNTLKGYSECKCSKGYMVIDETTTDNLGTTTCEEKRCATSNECKEKYLCYSESGLQQSGICSTRLKGCDGVRCSTEQDGCREAPSGFAECLCDEQEYTSVTATETGVTRRTCHTLTCATSNDCDGTALCYKDSITEDVFCDATQMVCTPEVLCPEGFHCDNSGVRPQCVCDDDKETQTSLTTRIIPMIDEDGRNISERYCYPKCANSDECLPGYVCYSDDTFMGNVCYGDRTRQADKCERLHCSSNTECLNDQPVTECFCRNGAATKITRTTTGSDRNCESTNVRCNDQRSCSVQPVNIVCLRDTYSLQAQCVDPNDVESCDGVRCSKNSFCHVNDNWSCGCYDDEQLYLDACFKRCTNDGDCEIEGLGDCDYDRLCELERTR